VRCAGGGSVAAGSPYGPDRRYRRYRRERHDDCGHGEPADADAVDSEMRSPAPGSYNGAVVVDAGGRLDRCLHWVVERTGVLAPERVGSRREVLVNGISGFVRLAGRADGDEFLERADPLAGEADDVLAPVPRCAGVSRIPVARFHGVCRPFLERPRPVRLLGRVVYRLNWFQFVSIREGRHEPQ
jgi:hypothetical protein